MNGQRGSWTLTYQYFESRLICSGSGYDWVPDSDSEANNSGSGKKFQIQTDPASQRCWVYCRMFLLTSPPSLYWQVPPVMCSTPKSSHPSSSSSPPGAAQQQLDTIPESEAVRQQQSRRLPPPTLPKPKSRPLPPPKPKKPESGEDSFQVREYVLRVTITILDGSGDPNSFQADLDPALCFY